MSYTNDYPKKLYSVTLRKVKDAEKSDPLLFEGVPTRYAILCALDWQVKNAELESVKAWWKGFYEMAVHLQIDGDYSGVTVKAMKHGVFQGDVVISERHLFPSNLINGELGPESYYNRKTEGFLVD